MQRTLEKRIRSVAYRKPAAFCFIHYTYIYFQRQTISLASLNGIFLNKPCLISSVSAMLNESFFSYM